MFVYFDFLFAKNDYLCFIYNFQTTNNKLFNLIILHKR